jgi:uncharacterized protein YjbI with pentapeptide repeats
MKNRRIPLLLLLLQCCFLGQNALAADFSGANLRGAYLTNADLRGSNLSGANLTDANLSMTDLRGANVTQQQVDSACGSGTKLPPGLRIQPCPSSTASSGPDRTGQRTNAAQALLEAHDDRDSFLGILPGVLPMAIRPQDSQQSP